MFIEITDKKGDEHLVNVNNIIDLSACEVSITEYCKGNIIKDTGDTEMVYSLVLAQNRHIYLTESQWRDVYRKLEAFGTQ